MGATTDRGNFGASFYLGEVGILLNILVFIYGMAVTEKLKDDQDNNGKTDTFELNSQITTRYQQADKPV